MTRILLRQKKNILDVKNLTIKLVILNIIVFVLQLFFDSLHGGTPLNGTFTRSLMLVSSDISTRPWILVTSMFLHGGINHLLFNMYALFMFGTLMENKIGTRRFAGLYFSAGILAALIPNYSAALGASGAIMGIIGLTIMLLPNMRVLLFFLFPMSMRTAGILFALLDIFGMISGGTRIANYSHLIGLSVGLAYGYYLKINKKEFQKRFNRPQRHNYNETKFRNSSEVIIDMDDSQMDDYLKYGRL